MVCPLPFVSVEANPLLRSHPLVLFPSLQHRTSSLDYNIITHGTITLLTPRVPSVPSQWPPSSLVSSRPDVRETRVSVGEVVVQRGTLHAWRNDTDEWVRWAAVLTDAEAVQGLSEVWVLEGEEKEGKGDVRQGKGM